MTRAADWTWRDPVLRKMWPRAITVQKIARHLGLAERTVTERAAKLGLEPRSTAKGERQPRADAFGGHIGLAPDDPGCGDGARKLYEATVRDSTRALAAAIGRAYPAYVAALERRA